MQPLDNLALADPSEEILVRVQPSFIHLAAVPVTGAPTAGQDSRLLND